MQQLFRAVILFALLASIRCPPNAGHNQQLESKQGDEMNVPATVQWVKILASHDCFSSISFGDDRHGIATGVDERFWLTSDGGNTWTEHSVRGEEIAAQGGANNLVRSAMTSPRHIYVLGQLEEAGSGILISLDGGKTWKIDQYPNSSLNGIDAVGDQIWVVGTINNVAAVLHSQDQKAWKQVWKGSNHQHLTDVDFIDANTGWAVGANGLILHTTDGGRTWYTQQAPRNENLESVAFADTKIGYIVGQGGVILHTADGGDTWSRQDSGIQLNLSNVVAVGLNTAWAVGQKGAVLYTKDGGQHWRRQGIGTEADIYAITINVNEVWIPTCDGIIVHSPMLQ